MKSIIESRYNLTPQDIYQQTIIQQDKTKLSEELQNNKNSCVFPKDNIDITGIAKQVIQSIDNRQVEITYSIPLKKISADIINKDGSRIEVKNKNLPKELGEISDPEVFSIFLKNTYAQVSMLSDGDYKFYINHKLLGGSQEYLNTIKRLSCDLLMNKITPKQVLVELGVNDFKNTNLDEFILFRSVVLVTGFIWQGIGNNSISIDDVNEINFKRIFDTTAYHLESCQKRLNNIIKVTKDRLSLNISSEQALRELDVDYRKYSNIDDAILVISIKQVKEYTLQELDSSRINIDNINSTYFGRILDKIIYSKQEQLVNEASYDLLLHLDKGLEGLKNKIFNKEDPFTIHAVKYFFNSVNSTQATEIDIQKYLKNDKFINFIYPKLQQQKFIITFKEFAIQDKPTDSERNTYDMPKGGICHGACLVSTTLKRDSFNDRNQILGKSSFLQREYHKVRNPDQSAIDNLLISKVIQAVEELPFDNDDKPPSESIKQAVLRFYNPVLPKNHTQLFLNEYIDLASLALLSRVTLQEQALQHNSNEEVRTFVNAEVILNDSDLSMESFNIILKTLNDKILLSVGQNKHLVLITLEDMPNKMVHDIMIRVDTDVEGYISQVIFSDLQDTGLYAIKATNNATIIKDAASASVKLINFYAKNLACNMFQIISAQYIKIES